MSESVVNMELLQAAIDAMPEDDLVNARQMALTRFSETGFPTASEEDWKYTSLSNAADISNAWFNSVVSGGIDVAPANTDVIVERITNSIDAHWIIMRNGIVDPAALDCKLCDGVDVAQTTLKETKTLACDDAMSAFNMALLRDCINISAAPNATPDKPVGILFVDNSSSAVTQTRVLVNAGDNSHVRLVEYSISADSGRQFSNAVVHVNAANSARVDYVRIQDRDREHTGVNRIHAKLDKDAGFQHDSFDLGGALTRNDVVSDLSGTGASVRLNGLYIGSGDQHIDNHTNIIHTVGPSTSKEEYRGILSGHSQCVFNGKVIVSPGADGADSSQSNHNLLLSDGAEIDTKPELEIYADDVKCAHGATVGQLDDTALFYLRSRGLDIDHARQMITHAFAAAMLTDLAVDECREHLSELLNQRLGNLISERS